MVLEDIYQIKRKLRSIERIKFSKHAEKKIETRKINKEFVIKNLRDPEKLRKFSSEPDKYPGEKYELYFYINKRKSLKVVVSFFCKDLNVVTSHIILNKRLKWVEKWRKKRK